MNFEGMLKASFLRNQAKAVFGLRLRYSSEGNNLDVLTHTSENSFQQPETQDYPATKQLPLPLNIEDLNSERLNFSPQRNRDLNGSFISSSTSMSSMGLQSDKIIPVDGRIECYDCSGTVNLNSSMQTSVPFPFVSRVKPIHLNMPGGQWRQKEKYVSEDLINVHHMNTRKLGSRTGTSFSFGHTTGIKNSYFCFPSRDSIFFFSPVFSFSKLKSSEFRSFCSVEKKTEKVEENLDNKNNPSQLTARQKFKILVKEYGPVAVVLHIIISATSLLIVYILVASGVDTSYVTKVFGASEGALTAETVTHFIAAYAIHKMLAPFRFGLSLTATPLVVKKLRKLGILKSRQQ